MSDLKQEILAMVKDDLAAIEIALEQNLNPYLDLISKVARHILFAGGKRLRPLLMVLSARLCGYKGDYDKTFSTVFEYLHAASLLHDDLIDNAAMRRSKPVAHSIWGNSAAILVGDFLLARSLSISAKTGNTENMSQGEIHQLMHKGELDISQEEYLEVIRRKTAVLFQGACRISAIITDAPNEKEKALADYGYNLGLAFQMADDLLDYTSDTKVLGKEVGADLKEGKLTLPVIYSLKAADMKDRSRMEKIIKNEDFTVNDFKTLVELLKKYKGISYTQKMAAEHIKKAKEALSIFEPSETKEILVKVADYALNRKA
jgi:octaprenyl-diphosphate synthase